MIRLGVRLPGSCASGRYYVCGRIVEGCNNDQAVFTTW